jgi:hypothetical protein
MERTIQLWIELPIWLGIAPFDVSYTAISAFSKTAHNILGEVEIARSETVELDLILDTCSRVGIEYT